MGPIRSPAVATLIAGLVVAAFGGCAQDAPLTTPPSGARFTVPMGQWMVGATFWISIESPLDAVLESADPGVLSLEPTTCDVPYACSVRAHAVSPGDALLVLRSPSGEALAEQLVGVRRPDRMVITSVSIDDVEVSMPPTDVWILDGAQPLQLRALVYAGTAPLMGAPTVTASLDAPPECLIRGYRDFAATIAALGIGDHTLTLAIDGEPSMTRTIALRGVDAPRAVHELRIEPFSGLLGRGALHAVALTAEGDVVHGVRDIEWTMDGTARGSGSVLQDGNVGDLALRPVSVTYERSDGSPATAAMTASISSYVYIRDALLDQPRCEP